MRCKKHPTDQSSSVGVCACCLRERLFAIITAQAQAQALKQAQQDSRRSDTQLPPPLPFPRSVSPYITRRKSDSSAAASMWQPHGHGRFYSTPQVGPNGSITVEIEKKKKKSNKRGKFSSLFLGLFRSKSDNKTGSESGPISDPSLDSCSASPLWFSNIISSRRKKKSQTSSIDERSCRNRGRGMSPARHADDEDEFCQSSGYSTESRQTPWRTPASARRGGGRVAGHSRNVSSGLAICLSPLVRPSPSRHWNQKGIPPEMVLAGEPRVTPKPHLSTAASFCKNRSRKLADLGRYVHDATY